MFKKCLLRIVGPRTRIYYRTERQTKYSTSPEPVDNKKLLIRNVFKDNPSAKYWLLGAFAVAAGVTYYAYDNQKKKRLVLDFLPSSPNHYHASCDEDVDKLKLLLQNLDYPKQVNISGPSGSGKTQLARLLAESIAKSQRKSLEFKLWPRDEVTGCLLANNKHSLLLSLKQLAVKLGCSEDQMKLDKPNVEDQLDVVSKVVKEKLKQKLQWILIIDGCEPCKQLTKWLPDHDWGKGYVINTIQSEATCDSEKKKNSMNYNLIQMSSGTARQLFLGVVNEDSAQVTLAEDPPENLLKLLHYNSLSVACAAIYFKKQIEQNSQYSYHNLYCDLNEVFKQLSKENPNTSELLNIQTTSVTLAVKIICKSSPELVHVFDLLGSCNSGKPIPLGVVLCHLKTPEYQIQLKSEVEMTSKDLGSSEESASSATVSLEGEHSLWSIHGIVARAVSIYERIKIEVDALKGLFGYGGAMSAGEMKAHPDGLEFIRSCPLLINFHEEKADVEVLSCHPIVHNVLRQLFLNVTIPHLEREHLLLAERKYQHKSYFSRLQRFNPQKAIFEYRKSLGDKLCFSGKEGVLPKVTGTPTIASILDGGSREDKDDQTDLHHKNVVGHLQEHFKRVVTSFHNFNRIAGSDSSGMVGRALLLPHLETLLHETCLTAASKGQVRQTMADINCNVLGDLATSKRLLDEAYLIYKESFGESSLEIAGLLTQQAELHSSADELDKSKELLERALTIYQKDRKNSQVCKQPFEYGRVLVLLGVIYGSLGQTARSKGMLEKGLMELQNAAPDDPHAKENKWFAVEISSAVTSLGHAYLSLGQIHQGRKLLELALIGHQNVHGDTHNEVMRTLTTLSIAHAMLGNSQESKRLRNEAGKIKKKLDTRSLLVL